MGIFSFIEALRYANHVRRLNSIKHRIHVNGSRGKSSVTRLVGAVLRGSMRTVVKTTGTSARFIYPDGREVPIFRRGKPNIIEQMKVVKKAYELGAEALVVECMAITPDYISILEDKLVRSTIGIITNVRADHLDVMGPTVRHVAYNLARSLPRKGIAFTAEEEWYYVLEEVARRRGTKLFKVYADEVSDEEMLPFPYIEHKENVALALKVAEHFGIDRKTALSRMYNVNPDPGVLREFVIGHVVFVNALAANDVASTMRIWESFSRKYPEAFKVALLVLRKDRPQRTESFASILGDKLKADHYLIVGPMANFVGRKLVEKGVSKERITIMEHAEAHEVVDAFLKLSKERTLVVAMGNIVGLGSEIVRNVGGRI